MFSDTIIDTLENIISLQYGKPINCMDSYDWDLPILEYPQFFIHTVSLKYNPLKWMWNWKTGLCKESFFITIQNFQFVIFKLPRLEIKEPPPEFIWTGDLYKKPFPNYHSIVHQAHNFAYQFNPNDSNICLDMHARNWGMLNGKWFCFDPFANEGPS